jgi:hypothetical protein
MFHNTASFYSVELSTLHSYHKLEFHLLSAVRDCIFNIFAATLHIGGSSSIRNLRTRLTQYCSGDKMDKNLMEGARSTNGGE